MGRLGLVAYMCCSVILLVQAQGKQSEGSRFSISVYYATYCGDSKKFINQQLWPAFLALGHLMNIELVPYGKTKESQGPNGTYLFECQQGPDECYANAIQSCAIYLLRDIELYLPLVQCMEAYTQPKKAVRRCARRLNLDFSQLESCATGPLGNRLQHEMGNKTRALSPPLHFIPWITVNGLYSKTVHKEALANFEGLVCEAYKEKNISQCVRNRS